MWYKLKRIMMRPNGVEKQVRPKGWWQPWTNTLLYLPLNSTDTYTDQSGNSRSTTNTSVTFWTYQWVDCWYFNGSSAHIQVTPFSLSWTLTFCVWLYNIYSGANYDCKILDARQWWNLYINFYAASWWYAIWDWPISNNYTKNQWILFVSTVQNWDRKLYLKWNWLDQNYTWTASFSSFTPTTMNIWNEHDNVASRFFAWWMSNLILENKIWTAQEISDYYNLTKANYWIS